MWLHKQKEYSSISSGVERKNLVASNSFIRFSSRKDSYDTITFTDVDSIPKILLNNATPPIPEKVYNFKRIYFYSYIFYFLFDFFLCIWFLNIFQICIITGETAKYRDPHTGYPFANLEAYRAIKSKYHIKNKPIK